MSAVFDNLSNDELREELMKRGLNVGPITQSTRNVYIKKLKRSLEGQVLDFEETTDASEEPFIQKSYSGSHIVNGSGDHFDQNESNNHSSVAYPRLDDETTSFLAEADNEEDDHEESMRMLTPEEIKNRQKYMSPMAKRREANKAKQFFLAYVCLFAIGCLLAFFFAKVFIFPFMGISTSSNHDEV